MGRGGSSRRLGAGIAVATAFAWALACGDDDEHGGLVEGGARGSGGTGGRDVVPPGTGAAPTSGGASSGGSGPGGASTGGTLGTGGTDASSVASGASDGGTTPDASDDGSTGSGGGTSSGGAAPTGGANSGGSSSGGTGSGGAVPTGGADGGDAGPRLPPCVPPRQVVLLGDSYVSGNGTPALQPFLSALSPHAAQFRNVSLNGAALASGSSVALVSASLDVALQQDPDVDVLIVDGGLSDILLCDPVASPGCRITCSRPGATSVKVCTDIASRAILAADALFVRAANAGIGNVVFFSYPHIPTQGGGYMDIFDFMATHIRSRCDALDVKTQGRSHCHFVDMVPPFKIGGDPNPANFEGEPPHPSAAGMTLMAKTLDTFLENHCLAQPSTNTCCR